MEITKITKYWNEKSKTWSCSSWSGKLYCSPVRQRENKEFFQPIWGVDLFVWLQQRQGKIYSRMPRRLKARMPTLGGRRHDAIVLRGRVVVAVKQRMTETGSQKCRKSFMRHGLQNIIVLVYSSEVIAFLREKVNAGRANATWRINRLKGGVRWVEDGFLPEAEIPKPSRRQTLLPRSGCDEITYPTPQPVLFQSSQWGHADTWGCVCREAKAPCPRGRTGGNGWVIPTNGCRLEPGVSSPTANTTPASTLRVTSITHCW